MLKIDETKAIGEKTENPADIQNVNGNIPDTTNAIDIGTHKKDSAVTTGKDSTK